MVIESNCLNIKPIAYNVLYVRTEIYSQPVRGMLQENKVCYSKITPVYVTIELPFNYKNYGIKKIFSFVNLLKKKSFSKPIK